jgi:hypothetical protein
VINTAALAVAASHGTRRQRRWPGRRMLYLEILVLLNFSQFFWFCFWTHYKTTDRNFGMPVTFRATASGVARRVRLDVANLTSGVPRRGRVQREPGFSWD